MALECGKMGREGDICTKEHPGTSQRRKRQVLFLQICFGNQRKVVFKCVGEGGEEALEVALFLLL